MGGSFGSLGGDFTSLSYNPAWNCIFYQNSELSITPNITFSETTSNSSGNKFTTIILKETYQILGMLPLVKTKMTNGKESIWELVGTKYKLQ